MTQKRRARGEGSIYRHKATGLWACAVTVGRDLDGKQRRRIIYGKTRAELLRRVFDEKARSGGSLQPRVEGTLREWAATWLEDDVRPNRERATWISYCGAWNHVEPILGDTSLHELSVDHVTFLARRLRAAGLSASMIARCLRVMHRCVAVAIRQGRYLRQNPFGQVEKPKPAYREKRALTIEEARRLLDAAADDRFDALWVALLTTGLRLGEALALKWSDVDFEARTINVRRSASEAGGRHVKDTKNVGSRRVVTFGDLALAALKRRRAAFECEPNRRSSLVFGSLAGTAMLRSNLIRRHWRPLLERAGIDGVQIRDLRRSSASLGAHAGIGPRQLADRLGHSTTRMTTEIYTRTMQGKDRAAADAIDAALAPNARTDVPKDP